MRVRRRGEMGGIEAERQRARGRARDRRNEERSEEIRRERGKHS